MIKFFYFVYNNVIGYVFFNWIKYYVYNVFYGMFIVFVSFLCEYEGMLVL